MHATFQNGRVEIEQPQRFSVVFQGGFAAEPMLIEPSTGRANFFAGRDSQQWMLDVGLHNGVRYRDLWPGIDLTYRTATSGLKSEFRVAPGMNPALIQLLYDGATPRVVDGKLELRTAESVIVEQPPLCWTGDGESKVAVTCAFSERDGVVGFEIGEYDPAQVLTIDPVVVFATYVGGSGFESATAMATDSAGNLYVTGWTDSSNFPVVGAYSSTSRGNDVFVFKLSSSGTSLLYATYIGGISDDRAFGIAVDSAGSAYIAGATSSTDFPLNSPFQSTHAGVRDGFVLKLSPDGSQIIYSSFLGGSGTDIANAVALDASNNLFVTGETDSTNFRTANPLQAANRGRLDAFLAKVDATGGLAFSTYHGGVGDDRGLGVAVDNQGGVYFTGVTSSNNLTTVSPFQAAISGTQDCFIAKAADSGSSLVYATYFGGSGSIDQCNAIAVDSSRNAYVVGVTNSTNLPLVNPFQTAFGGGSTDGFVSKLNAAGSALVYSTYYGTMVTDNLNAIALDSAGQAHVAGRTNGGALPIVDAIQTTQGGLYDAYAARIKATGGSVDFSSYFGGNGSESANAIAVLPSGTVYIAGQTTSMNMTTVNAYQGFGGAEGSVFVLGFNLTPPTVPASPPSTGPSASPSSSIETRQRWTLQVSDPNGWRDISIVSIVTSATTSTAQPTCHLYYNRSQNLFYLYSDTNTPLGGIAPGSAGTLENSQCKFYAATSSATGNVNNLVLVVDLERKSAFLGSKNVYLWVNDTTNRSAGLDAKAVWSITAQNSPPATGPSVTPNGGTSARQTLTFQPSDPNGFTDLAMISVVVANTAAAPPGTCHAYFNRLTNAWYLMSDNNQSLGPLSPGSPSILQNSQCILYGQNTGSSGAGTTLTLTVDLEMMPTYSGVKNIYLWAMDALQASTALDPKGTWDIPAAPNQPPSTGPAAEPAAATGTRNLIRVVPSDPNGYQDIRLVSVVINGTATVQTNSCHIYLNRLTNLFYLYSDSNSPLGGVSPGSAQTLENSQCKFYAATSSVSGSGNNLTMVLDIERKPAYSGNKGVYVWLNDTKDAVAGLDQKATWNMP